MCWVPGWSPIVIGPIEAVSVVLGLSLGGRGPLGAGSGVLGPPCLMSSTAVFCAIPRLCHGARGGGGVRDEQHPRPFPGP